MATLKMKRTTTRAPRVCGRADGNLAAADELFRNCHASRVHTPLDMQCGTTVRAYKRACGRTDRRMRGLMVRWRPPRWNSNTVATKSRHVLQVNEKTTLHRRLWQRPQDVCLPVHWGLIYRPGAANQGQEFSFTLRRSSNAPCLFQ